MIFTALSLLRLIYNEKEMSVDYLTNRNGHNSTTRCIIFYSLLSRNFEESTVKFQWKIDYQSLE